MEWFILLIIFNISFIGGEPFLWKPISKLSKIMATEYGVEISTTTNGILLSKEEVRKNVIDYFSEIVISVDGFEECNVVCYLSRGQ